MAKPLPPGVKIRPGNWLEDAPAIAAVRRGVFIEEQGVPEALEWEAIDPECDWFVAQDGDTLVATARLTPQGRIGRMAVLADWRGKGIGTRLLDMALARAVRLGLARVELHAQCHALGFYQRFGFAAEGPEFSEADIPHRHMVLHLRGG
ncbi:MAG: GNAT family N-acetyltransferase [Hydrogenophilaceae bacterium]